MYKPVKDIFKSGTECDAVMGKYFIVKKHIPYSNDRKNTRGLYELEMKDAPYDIVYYHFYDVEHLASSFLNVGYVEKTKQLNKGKVYYYYDDRNISLVYKERLKDLEKGESVSGIPNGSEFVCTDVVLKYVTHKGLVLVLIFNNPQLGSYFCTLDNLKKTLRTPEEYAVRKERDNYLIEKYGKENFDLMCAGKVRIGWNEEMCREAWGDPRTVNTSSDTYGRTEQWVYYSKYLYFEKGKLVSIQD